MAENPEDELLFREIDEELKQEQWRKLWHAYGKYAVAAVAALVLGVAGYEGWRSYDLNRRQAAGERFQAAMEIAAADRPDDALQAFGSIAADGGAGYAMLARFQAARILARRGDAAGAAAAYHALAGDDGIDPLYRDLATVLGAMQELNAAGADAAAIRRRVEPLTADANPWRHSAREILGLVALGTGDRARAAEAFSALAADAGAPQGVRQRAQEMLSILSP